MVNLAGSFSRLAPAKIGVIGDFMLDKYTIGKPRRISPEAPVVVVDVHTEEYRAGGAGNVVLNLLSMGATVSAIGRIGDDSAGNILRSKFSDEGLPTNGFFIQPGFQTPIKNRIIAENQQIVRVDYEKITPLSEIVEEAVINALPQLLEGIQVLAISDYNKGFLSDTLLSAIIEYAKKQKIIVIADPKGIDFTKYSGTTIIKPNVSEVYAAANLPRGAPLEVAAKKVLEDADAQVVMVTRSEEGLSLFFRNGERHDFPVHIHEVKDVTGAGDTVLAILACGLASDLDIREAAPLCNIAGSIAIERFGCARVSLSDMARKLLWLDSGNKIFDREHLFALKQALKGKKVIALDLQDCQDINLSIFQTISRLGQHEGEFLLAHVPNAEPSSPIVNILKEMQAIDFILIGNFEIASLCEILSINEIYKMDKIGR